MDDFSAGAACYPGCGRACAPHQITGEHDPNRQGASPEECAVAETVLAVAASSWAVLMAIAPILQIRRMLRERSSRQVSVAYFGILLVGFVLWISYGAAAGLPAVVIPNIVAVLVGTAVVTVALRLRR
jgi:MtN3 and saliva related transmembrane protein